MTQSIEDLIAERDMLKRIVIKQYKPHAIFSTGVKHIRAYFNVMGDVVYGYLYDIPGSRTKKLNRMGYDSVAKAQKGLEIALLSEKRGNAS